MSQPGATSGGVNKFEQFWLEGETKAHVGPTYNSTYNINSFTILVVPNEKGEVNERLTTQPLSTLAIEKDVAKLGENVAELAATSASVVEVDVRKSLAAFLKSKGTLDNIEERLGSPKMYAKEQIQKNAEVSAQETVGISTLIRNDTRMIEKHSLELRKRRTLGTKSHFGDIGSGSSDLDATKGKGTVKTIQQTRYPFLELEATAINNSLRDAVARHAARVAITEKQAKSSSTKTIDDTAINYVSLFETQSLSRLANAVIDKPTSHLAVAKQTHIRNRTVGAKPLSTESDKSGPAVLSVQQVVSASKVNPNASLIRLKPKPSINTALTSSPVYPSARAQPTLSQLQSTHTKLFPTDLQPLLVRPLRPDSPGILGWKKSARSVLYMRESLLLHYAKRGMLGELGELLRNKPMNMDEYAGSYGNALHSAVAYGQRNAIPLLLHHGANINFQLGPASPSRGAALPDYCRNAVMIAIARQDNEMLKFLILNGAKVNMEVPKVDSALKLAVLMGNLEITQTLVGHGAVIHDDAKELGDALQAAAFGGDHVLIRYLCDNGAMVNHPSGALGCALQAASCMNHLAAVCLLLQRGAFDFPCGTIFGSALHAAAFAGSVAIVKMLLDQGQAHVNAYGGIYGFALHAAARQGHVQVVKALLEAGANVNQDIRLEASTFGTPLQAAALCGADNVTKELLARGADPDGVGRYATKTPLVHAIEQDHPRVVFSLVNGGAVLEPKDREARPLSTACEAGKAEISSFLISMGARPTREDIVAATNAGHVAVAGVLLDSNSLWVKESFFLHTAIHKGRKDMAALFIKHGADTNQVNKDVTPLQRAVRNKNTAIVQLLLGHGADPNGLDHSNEPPLILAVERLDTNIVQILVDAGADPNKRGINSTKAVVANSLVKCYTDPAKSTSIRQDQGIMACLRDLTRHAKEIEQKEKAMESPMRIAVEKGAPEILDILLKHNGNANESGANGVPSLLSLAIAKGNADIVDRLLKAGADVQAETLPSAIAKGQMDVVRCVLCAGALLKHHDDVLLPAIKAQNRALVKILLEHGAKVEPKHQLAAGANNMLSMMTGQLI